MEAESEWSRRKAEGNRGLTDHFIPASPQGIYLFFRLAAAGDESGEQCMSKLTGGESFLLFLR